MIKVWIVGSNGQIGHALNEVLDPLEIEVLNTDKDELDITDTEEVLNFGIVNRPDVIINCTGVTDTKVEVIDMMDYGMMNGEKVLNHVKEMLGE